MSLPIFQTDSKDVQLLQTGWAQQLNPLIENPINQGLLLSNVKLISGTTVINHTLGRKMQGWILADVSAPATVYRSQPFNSLTLTLISNAAVTVNLMVF